MKKLLTALVRYMARAGVSDTDKVNAALHDLGVYLAAQSGQPHLLRGFLPRSALPDLAEEIEEGLAELREAVETDAFIEKVFELCFGHDAINREFSQDEALRKIREFSDKACIAEGGGS